MKSGNKYQFKTWWGELCGNTIALTICLAFVSFLNVATEGTLFAIAATSFWWSFRARKNPIRTGLLPSVISTSILQLGYFISGREMFPLAIAAGMFVGNLLIISAISGVFSWIGAWIRNKTHKKKTSELEEKEKIKSQFSERIKTLAIVTLIFYIQMFIAVPFMAKVSAATNETPDEFIQNYDPEKEYKTSSKTVLDPAKRRMPLESPYGNVTGSELEQLETYCKINGCTLTTVGAQLSMLRQSGHVSLSSYIEQLNEVYAPKPVQTWKTEMVFPKMIKNVKDKFAGKGSKAKPDNRPWWQKGLSAVQAYHNARNRFDQEFTKKFVIEPAIGAFNFAKAHPFWAAGIVAAAATAIFWAPAAAFVAAAAAPVGLILGAIALIGIGKAYYDGGWNGVKNNIFSKETQTMWRTGDKAGAAGRGVAELLTKALEILPIAEAPKVVKATVKGVPLAIKFIKEVPKIRVSIAIVDDMGLLKGGAKNILQNMSRIAGDQIEKINPFMLSLTGDQFTLAILNKEGASLKAAGKVAGVEEGILAEKKAGNMVNGIKAAQNKLSFKIDLRTLPRTTKTAVSRGTLAKPSRNTNYTFEELQQIENANPRAHGIFKHVEKDNTYLEQRLAPKSIGGENLPAASTFSSKEAYVDQVNRTLSRDSDKIMEWLKDPSKDRIALDKFQNDEIIGRVMKKNLNHTQIATDSKLILEKNGRGGYYILTSPVFKP